MLHLLYVSPGDPMSYLTSQGGVDTAIEAILNRGAARRPWATGGGGRCKWQRLRDAPGAASPGHLSC